MFQKNLNQKTNTTPNSEDNKDKEPEEQQQEEPEEQDNEKKDQEVERVKVTCPRCKGDGTFHSSKTGVRAATAADTEPVADPTRVCPRCKGKKKIMR